MNARTRSVLMAGVGAAVVLIPGLVLGQESPLEESARRLGEGIGHALANVLIFGGIIFGLFALFFQQLMASAVRLGIQRFLRSAEGRRLLETISGPPLVNESMSQNTSGT